MTYLRQAFIAATCSLVTAVAAARTDNKVLEASIETTADQVTLPTNAGGIVIARSCAACPIQTLRLAPGVDLYLNGSRMELTAMKNAMAAAKSTPVTIHYRLADSLISRIVLSTSAAR